jgi:Outer membrane protein beta-barrel domain
MKTNFLVLCMVLTSATSGLNAQDRFEVRVGLNYASLEKAAYRFLGNLANADWRTGMSAGIRYTIPRHNWRFGAGFDFSIKGEKVYLEKEGSRPFYLADIKYIEMPLTATRVIRSKYLVSVGVYGGYAVQRQTKGYVVNDPVRKAHRAYRKTDIGMEAGIGYQFFQRYTIGLAYGFSFLDLQIEQQYSRYFNLHINYTLFPLKQRN